MSGIHDNLLDDVSGRMNWSCMAHVDVMMGRCDSGKSRQSKAPGVEGEEGVAMIVYHTAQTRNAVAFIKRVIIIPRRS